MPVDFYPNKSVEELTGLLKSLQDRQIKGGITQVQAAGVMTTRDLSVMRNGNSRIEVELKRVLYSLYLRASGTPAAKLWANPYAGRIRRTRSRYTYS